MTKVKSLIIFSMALLAITLVMTYPTLFNLDTGVRKGMNDSIFDIWVISQHIQKILNPDFTHYFDGNIFYPYKNTLMYSNHYFTQSLLSLPVYLLTKNPVIIYNILLLFSFFTSAWGMFILARYLTGSSGAGLIAGLIFAFSPFMISHFSHMQILTAGGIPLAFFFLHKFFNQERFRDILLFSLFFILQFLASGHYAMYLTLFCGLYFLIHMLTHQKFLDGRFWIKIGLFLLVCTITLSPFLCKYVGLQQDIGFARGGATGASLTQYLAANGKNLLYGRITRPFQKMEGALFPGIMAFVLAMFGLFGLWKKKSGLTRTEKDWRLITTLMLVGSFLFSFGMKGPYYFLHRYVPGFNGVRVAQRFHIMVMFALAILAAYGIRFILIRLKTGKGKAIMGLAVMVIILEYISIPIPLTGLPGRSDIPLIYRHLEKIEDNGAIIEFPVPENLFRRTRVDSMRMYYSIYHNRKMVNGRSSYFPPLYYEIRQRWKHGPMGEVIADLDTLDVTYLIIHSDLMRPRRFDSVRAELSRLKDRVLFLDRFDTAWLYEIIDKSRVGDNNLSPKILSPISREGWTVKAKVNNRSSGLALDGKVDTWWQSPPQRKGDYFMLDMGQSRRIKSLNLKLSPASPCSYPLRYRVDISENGQQWTRAAESRTRIPIRDFLKPTGIILTIDMKDCRARYINIICTGQHRRQVWTISEIQAFQ